ncbi:MAG: hypothetical protein O3B73_09205 [bacterium]|nr:hypothetical protein [bacterium]
MINTQTSLSGLKASAAQQAASAHTMANLGTDGFAGQRTTQQSQSGLGVSTQVDTVTLSDEALAISEQVDGAQNGVDIAEESVSQIQSRENFKQNAAAIRTQDHLLQSLIDIVA